VKKKKARNSSLRTLQKPKPKSKTPSKTKQDKNLEQLPESLLIKIHDLMVKSRILEERLIKIYKKGNAYFWIGGPGEESFGVPLGLLVDKGQGHDHDWLHFHYRCTPTLLAMGMLSIDAIRLIMNRATDPHSHGKNFSGHYCIPEWNVAAGSSPIEVQYSIAIGTAWAQKRRKAKGITIVTGGDAGSAEPDFASNLIWSSRPGNELPILITVQNNKWGISTSYETQHGESHVSERGKAFGIKTALINGNDPVESYIEIKKLLSYVRKNKKPVLAEFMVSRLYGHSSADGANFRSEPDNLKEFERTLLKNSILTNTKIKSVWEKHNSKMIEEENLVQKEPAPDPSTIWDCVYKNNENANWRQF
jgi:2-oxoisovalerate dehydrogenase E1 component alpha subunit